MIQNKNIKAKITAVSEEVKEWFRYLHENPELGFEEINTSEYVEQKLRSFGKIQVKRVGKTGVLGILDTGKPGNTVAFRADMDALPILESEDHVVRSKNAGIMHACGHDGHTATLLGAAKILSESEEYLCGQIRFVFQPSEEIQPGGAKMMIDNKTLEGTDYIFGLHYSIDEEPGYFSIHSGRNFAANYKFRIIVSGKEGHAAFPHLAQDTIATASEIVNTLHKIVSREIDPLSSAVLSVTQIHGGSTYNSLPEKVEIGGTIRFLDHAGGRILLDRAEQIAAGIGKIYGCEVCWELEKGCSLLYNSPEIEERVKKVLENAFGMDRVLDHPPVMGCEDFSEYLEDIEGAYFRVGCRTVEADGTVYPTHNSGYRLNEDALAYGVSCIVEVISAFLEDNENE